MLIGTSGWSYGHWEPELYPPGLPPRDRLARYAAEVLALLERHGAAYCVMSGAKLPCLLRVTAGFAYVRMHGPDHHHLYAGSYSDTDLRWWADRCREWDRSGHDVFVYFNNDGEANAVRNARNLRALVA
jgi:uncharacterized protein YecE (DUF72 family)